VFLVHIKHNPLVSLSYFPALDDRLSNVLTNTLTRGNCKMFRFVTLASILSVFSLAAPSAFARTIEIRSADAICVRENLEKYLALPDDPIILVQGSCPATIGLAGVKSRAGPKIVKKPKALVLRKSELRCIAEVAPPAPRAGKAKGVMKIELSACR
jgi:hypothetical protein